MTLGSTVSSFTVQKALNIANGESLLSSGSSVINLSDTLTVANGGKLTSGTGNRSNQRSIDTEWRDRAGLGTLNSPQAVTVGATGKLDASDSDGVSFGNTLNIAGGGKFSSVQAIRAFWEH